MNTLIYDYYGYFVDNNFYSFDYKGWHFCLLEHNKEEMELADLNNLVCSIDETLYKQGVSILQNKNHNYLSMGGDGKAFSLVGVKIFNVNIDDLYLMHRKYLAGSPLIYNYRLSNIKELWIRKLEYIENDVISSIPSDLSKYEEIMSLVYYYIGLGENAIGYLEDVLIDLGEKVSCITITHKRLYELNSFELLNPFNLVIDSPMRDFAYLYNSELINIDGIDKAIMNYKSNVVDVSYLFSRILYPNEAFDLLEDYYNGNKLALDKLIEKGKLENKKKKRIKSLHNFLHNKYLIRNIEWINK